MNHILYNTDQNFLEEFRVHVLKKAVSYLPTEMLVVDLVQYGSKSRPGGITPSHETVSFPWYSLVMAIYLLPRWEIKRKEAVMKTAGM